MASTAFCQLNNAYGFEKINAEYPLTGNKVDRNCLVLSASLRAVQRPTPSCKWTQGCHDRTSKSLLSSKRGNTHDRIIVKSVAEPAIAPNEVEMVKEAEMVKGEEEISRATLIWRAIKLPMYTVALIPVSVGAAAAYWQTGVFSAWRYFMILASYVIVNVWVNLSNDVYDFDTGVDKNKKESVVNLFGNRNLINNVAWSLLGIGFLGLTCVAMAASNPRSLVLAAAAVFCFYLYQIPPFRMSYYGVGEPLLFIAYGPLSTIAFYLLHSRASELPISSTIIWASILVGFTTSLILFCSHFHQIEDDKAEGKISPLVRLGTEAGSVVVKMSVIGLYALVLMLGATRTLPLASVILCAMTLPMGNLVVSFVQKNHMDKTKIFMGKYYCVRLHTVFGAALAAGLVVARVFAKTLLPPAAAVL